MQTATNETTDPVIMQMTEQAEAAKAQAEALWPQLIAAEKEMEPLKAKHDDIRSRWARAYETNRVLTQLISQRTTREGK